MSRRAQVALIALILVSIEGSSVLTLYLVGRLYSVRYAPLSVTSILPRYRETLNELLAGRATYTVHSPTLGWTIKPNGHTALYRANSQGIRGDREYGPAPPAMMLRISTFGDSFTHASNVTNEDTWQEALMRNNRRLEVINFGVAGYGLDQAFLRYQHEGAAYRSHIVLIGYMSENLNRSVSVFRPFYFQGTPPLTKPRFILEGNTVVLVPNPLKDLQQYQELLAAPERMLSQLGTHDYFFHVRYRTGPFDLLASVRLLKMARYQLLKSEEAVLKGGFYNRDSEAFRVTVATFDQFVSAVTRDGALPIIVVFPNGQDIARYRRDGTRRYSSLLEHFRKRDYRYIDLLDWFGTHARGASVQAISPGHYSTLGNRLVADAVWNYLSTNGLLHRINSGP